MRNLKKVLSLVLVVAMLASMMIVGAAAAEPEKTNYPEAAAVIAGIKVMEGDEGGMRYGDTVTREEAAAIICRILLGSTAETLKTTTAPFEDVAASRWSAGYIAYLKAQGIVSGVSDTEFDPTAKVTGIAFAKMLLTAVGYGKVGEFEGSAWDINTITLSNELGIYTATKAADLAAGATREECMLYAFNTITKVPTVKYNKTFESYYVGPSAMSPVTGPAALAYTLGATKFNLGSTPVEDNYGRPAVTYTLGTEVLASKVVNAEPLFTVPNAVIGATLYAKLGAAAAAKITTIDQWVDGVKTPAAFATSILAVADLTPVAGQGAVTEAYLDSTGTTLTLVTYYEYIGQVTAINATTGVATLSTADTGIFAGVAVNDYVVYTKGVDVATSAVVTTGAKAAPVTGAFQKVNAQGLCVIGGVTYTASAKISGTMPAATAANFGKDFNVYTDSLGNALLVTLVPGAVVTSNDYLYLLDSAAAAAVAGSTFVNEVPATAKLQVVYADGGKAVVDYAITKNAVDGKYYWTLPGASAPSEVASGTVAAPGWYSYTTNSEGKVTLVAAAAVTNAGLGVTTGKFDVTGAPAGSKANSKTVLNIVNVNGAVSTYTGISKFPTYAVGSGAGQNLYATMIVVNPLTNTIEAINAYAAADGVAVEIPTIGFCAEALGQDLQGYHYNFYINGEKVEVVNPTASGALTVGSAYNMTKTGDVYAAATEATISKAVLTAGVYDDAHIIAPNGVEPEYFQTKDGTAVYFNALTNVFDLANGGAAGTLTAGRAVSYMVDGTNTALYVWMH